MWMETTFFGEGMSDLTTFACYHQSCRKNSTLKSLPLLIFTCTVIFCLCITRFLKIHIKQEDVNLAWEQVWEKRDRNGDQQRDERKQWEKMSVWSENERKGGTRGSQKGGDEEEMLEIRGGEVAWECEWEQRGGGERWGEERRSRRQERAGERQWKTHPPHRSIFQQQLQRDVSTIVILGELGGPPHVLGIGDPHPSTLRRKGGQAQGSVLDCGLSVTWLLGFVALAMSSTIHARMQRQLTGFFLLILSGKQDDVRVHWPIVCFVFEHQSAAHVRKRSASCGNRPPDRRGTIAAECNRRNAHQLRVRKHTHTHTFKKFLADLWLEGISWS